MIEKRSYLDKEGTKVLVNEIVQRLTREDADELYLPKGEYATIDDIVSSNIIEELKEDIASKAASEDLALLKSELLGDDLEETFNTLKEVQEWADEHGTEYSELIQVVNNKADISDLSNIFSEEIIDNDILPDLDVVTRDELKKELFVDMWTTAGGKYNSDTKFFELNGLTDITYEQALTIYMESSGSRYYYPFGKYMQCKSRTFFPLRSQAGNYAYPLSTDFQFHLCRNLEVLVFEQTAWNRLSKSSLKGCAKLKRLMLYGNATDPDAFSECVLLERIQFHEQRTPVNLPNHRYLDYETFRLLVNNSNPTTAITHTVHQNIMSALLGESTTYPFNGGTQELWTQLLQDATNKQITFATV